jgi:teichuronic acid biosynthesis glycosyltransferase TuaH
MNRMSKIVRILKEEGPTGLLARVRNKLQNACKPALSSFHGKKLQKIMGQFDDKVRGVIIYPPTVGWNITLFQRPHHLAIQLAKQGYLFFFCTGNHWKDDVSGFRQIEERLYLTNRYDLLLEMLPDAWIILSSTNDAITVADIVLLKRRGFRIIYDYIDEIHADITGGIEAIRIRHAALTSDNVDLVANVAVNLYNEMRRRFPEEMVMMLPNAADYEHFQVKRSGAEPPADMRRIIDEAKPVIGYYGALAKWIDYELLSFVARKKPDWNIVLIGVDYDGSMKSMNMENIKYLGRKKYDELPQYGIWFDVAVIPFKEGDIAKATSPLKLYEYMAMKKPVVVTRDLIECRKYKGVLVANCSDEFIGKIEEALKLKDNPVYLKLLDEQAKKNTWVARAQEIGMYIERNLVKKECA